MANLISQIILQSSNDFIITILTWELMNQSQYLQITMQGNTNTGTTQSAGIKYFQQSAQTTAFMQMGITQIYSKTGSVNYEILISMFYIINIFIFDINNFTQYLGLFIMIITIMFKQGASPFHFWAPDLYDSLPTPILIYTQIIPKIAILIFQYILMPIISKIITFSFINSIAIFSIIIGSIGLISQWKIKRFLTYSAISHIGFILFAYISYSWDYYFYYIFIYGFTNLIILQIILSIGNCFKGNDDDIIFIEEQDGIFKMNPYLATILSQTFFSLAGIPPLIGFFLKFQIIQGIIENFKIHQTIILIFGSIISTICYLFQIKNFNLNYNAYTYKKIKLKNYKKFFIEEMVSLISAKQIFYNKRFSPGNYYYFISTQNKPIFLGNFDSVFASYHSDISQIIEYEFKEFRIPDYISVNFKTSNSYIISQLFLLLVFLFFKFNILNVIIENIFIIT